MDSDTLLGRAVSEPYKSNPSPLSETLDEDARAAWDEARRASSRRMAPVRCREWISAGVTVAGFALLAWAAWPRKRRDAAPAKG